MEVPKASENQALKQFVREVLGCNCPEEVFQNIQIARGSKALAAYPADYQIAIGGRLLIVVVTDKEPAALNKQFASIVAEGKQVRDAGGFNRFRLVVLSAQTSATGKLLQQQFDKLPSRDEKIHLHVVSAASWPL